MVTISLCDPAASAREASFDPIVVPNEVVRAGGGDARPMQQSDVDRVQRTGLARTNGGRIATDAGGIATLASPATQAARAIVCPDLTAAGDAHRPWWKRLAHAVFLCAGIAGGPDAAALKALGLHAVESTATHAVYSAAEDAATGATRTAGRLIVPHGAGKMTEAERSVASYLVRAGHEVVRIPEATKDGVRSADFLVDGKLTELKTLSNIASPNFTGAVIRRIREAAAQAPNVLIDAR